MTAAAVKRLGVQLPAEKATKDVRGTQERSGTVSEVRLDSARTLTLPYPPSTNNMFFTTPTGHRAKTSKAKDFAEEVGKSARIVFSQPVTVPVEVSLVFHPKRGLGLDCGNVEKAVLDACTGIVWRDDSQVWRLVIERGAVIPGGRLVMVVKAFER